jgi:hypothetical protein
MVRFLLNLIVGLVLDLAFGKPEKLERRTDWNVRTGDKPEVR